MTTAAVLPDDPDGAVTALFRAHYVVDDDGSAEAVVHPPGAVRDMAFDRRGALLFVDATGLWRYDRARDKAVLLVRGATAVAG